MPMLELPSKQFISSLNTVTTTGSITTGSVLIVAANPNRRGFTIWNNSANSVYITFAATSTSAAPTFILATFATLQFVSDLVWTGPISGIRNSGSGAVTIAEFS